MNRNVLLGVLALGGCVLVGGCLLQSRMAGQEVSASKQLFAMDTIMKFDAYGKNAQAAVDAAAAEVQRLDALFSTGREDSEISLLNATGEGKVSQDTAAVIREGIDIYEQTEGLFDMTIYPLMELWGFTDKAYHVPSQTEIQEVLPLVDSSKISLEEGGSSSGSASSPDAAASSEKSSSPENASTTYVSLGKGQKIDLGGIAKGYTSARVMEIYREYGISSGMVYLGGNVQVLGKKPDKSKWRIGIQNPRENQGETLAVLQVQDAAVITSGGYERYFEENGKTYIHILDPRTGYPADNTLASVTVVSPDGMLADALSTSLFVMGLDKARDYWEKHSEEFDMVLVDKDGNIYITRGIEKDFETQKEYQVLK